MRRAVEGVIKPVFHQGKRVGTLRVYSDSLLMFLLRARRPEKFADRAGTTSDSADDLIARLKAGRARIEQRAGAMPDDEPPADPDPPDTSEEV